MSYDCGKQQPPITHHSGIRLIVLFVLCYSIVILLLLLLVLPDNVTNTQHTPQCTVGKFRGGPHYLVADHFFLSKPTQISILRSHMAS